MSKKSTLENRKMAEFEYFMDHTVHEKNLKPVDVMTWLAIFRLSDQNGVSNIDEAEIRRTSGIKSQRTLKNTLQHLIDLDLIKPVTSEHCKESQWMCLSLKKE